MDRDERQQLRSISDEVAHWVEQARGIVTNRVKAGRAGDEAITTLRRRVLSMSPAGLVAWRVLPLGPGDVGHLRDIAREAHLPAISPADEKVLEGLTTDAAAAIRDAKAVVGARRFVSGGKKRQAGDRAAGYLGQYRDWGVLAGVPPLLDGLAQQHGDQAPSVPISDALAPWVGLQPRLADLGSEPALLTVAVVAELPVAMATIDTALEREERFRSDARAAGEAVRKREVRSILAEMPVERLREATRDRLRVGPLTDAGVTTVQAVIDRGPQLEYLPGIGATTATRMRGAAQALWQTTYEEMPVRIDLKNRTSEATNLLRLLGVWDAMRQTKGAASDLALKEALSPLATVLDKGVSHIVVWANDRTVIEFREAAEAVVRRGRQLSSTSANSAARDPWDDFLARPADYFAMLSELGFLAEDEAKTHGDLPDDILEAIREIELDTQYLSASLRGYQSFGARFALVQRKVIIGDEMGLGKTVEALAVLAHLRAKGAHHALVICPAAVVTNWIREVQTKSKLRSHRVHGPGREAAARSWLRDGGVAVTTFETLHWLEPRLLGLGDLGCVVVDEAHYIKNPGAKRSQRASAVIKLSDRAILLTGTPLENRIDEFRNLVGYIRPELVLDASELAPRRFRRQVAPAYLRRNQEDVLTELPELVEVSEWLPMSSEDAAAYRDAVAAGNFMAMRQAAMSSGHRSEKVKRLVEIVQEAADNGRRVIVFSHFRDALDQVARSLPGKVFGPLTGSVPAAARQVMIDQFSAAAHGAVLVSQIIAGGVGLNIQAASVVIICEPQLKPTTEWQAIARAHRMGQLESVQVHRLLSEEGVDQRITEILARKREIFEEFARVSETADSAPEAFDVSEAELARDVVASERERLFQRDSAGANDEAAINRGTGL